MFGCVYTFTVMVAVVIDFVYLRLRCWWIAWIVMFAKGCYFVYCVGFVFVFGRLVFIAICVYFLFCCFCLRVLNRYAFVDV